jgi:hypothetical protein
MKAIEAFLAMTIASALFAGGCGFGPKKKKDSQASPQPEVPTVTQPQPDPDYPIQVVSLSADEFSILQCQEDGVKCKASSTQVVLISDLLSAREIQLGIPALKVSQDKLLKDLASSEERSSVLNDLQAKSDIAPARVQEIDRRVATLTMGIEDLENNIAVIDNQLLRTPGDNKLLAQRVADAQTLADKESIKSALTSEKTSLVELINGNDARSDELDTLHASDNVKREEFNKGSKDLAEKTVSLEVDTKILAALPRNVNLKMSELETKLPWLKNAVASTGEEK